MRPGQDGRTEAAGRQKPREFRHPSGGLAATSLDPGGHDAATDTLGGASAPAPGGGVTAPGPGSGATALGSGGGQAAAPDTIAGSREEPVHVEGAAADLPVAAWPAPPEAVKLTAATLLPMALPPPEAAADSASPDRASPDSASADSASGGSGAAVPLLIELPGAVEMPSDDAASGLLLADATPQAAPAGVPPETQRTAWRDPVSVAGASVLTIGAATVVLSALGDGVVPEQSATAPPNGRFRVAAAPAGEPRSDAASG